MQLAAKHIYVQICVILNVCSLSMMAFRTLIAKAISLEYFNYVTYESSNI